MWKTFCPKKTPIFVSILCIFRSNFDLFAKLQPKSSQNAVECRQNAVKMQSKCSQNAVNTQSKCSQNSVKIQSKFSQNPVKIQSNISQNSVKIQ